MFFLPTESLSWNCTNLLFSLSLPTPVPTNSPPPPPPTLPPPPPPPMLSSTMLPSSSSTRHAVRKSGRLPRQHIPTSKPRQHIPTSKPNLSSSSSSSSHSSTRLLLPTTGRHSNRKGNTSSPTRSHDDENRLYEQGLRLYNHIRSLPKKVLPFRSKHMSKAKILKNVVMDNIRAKIKDSNISSHTNCLEHSYLLGCEIAQLKLLYFQKSCRLCTYDDVFSQLRCKKCHKDTVQNSFYHLVLTSFDFNRSHTNFLIAFAELLHKYPRLRCIDLPIADIKFHIDFITNQMQADNRFWAN